MINRLHALMIMTFKEGVRDRALVGIGLFSLILISASLVFVSLFMRELSKVAVDVNLSAITFAGLMMTFFISINLMAKDMDKHTIYCVLSKPISRSEYIWGKFLGIMLLILAAFTILTGCSTLVLYIIKNMYSQWFATFEWLTFYKAVYTELMMFAMVNALVVFFSTITTSSFITLLFSISTYIAGQTIEEVVLYLKSQPDIDMTNSVKIIINISQYFLPNLAAFDMKTNAAYALPISWAYMACVTAYAFIYSSVLLILASFIFKKRELL